MSIAQQASEAEQIEEIIEKDHDQETKKTLVESLKQSSLTKIQKVPTFQTGLSLAITMMGTTILVLPVLFFQQGIVSALIISIIIAIISGKTCQLLVIHNKEEETDLPSTLLRVLGSKWKKGYIYSTVLVLWLSGLIYQILVVSQIYPIIELIGQHAGFSVAPQDKFTFSELSYQWVGIAYSICIFPLFCLKKLGVIVKITSYGNISVFLFVLFSIYEGIKNLMHHKPTETKYLTLDFANLGGVFSLALLIQSVAIPILKNNQNQETNGKAIVIGFSWVWFVYSAVGVFGAFAICGITKRDGTPGTTFLDFFPLDDPLVIIVQIFLFLKLTAVYPVLQFVARSQFCMLIYGFQRPPRKVYYGFTVFYVVTSLLAQLFSVNLTMLLGLTGAIVGLVQEYIIPIALHLTCLYKSKTAVHQEKRKKDIQNENSEHFSDSLVENPDGSKLKIDEEEFKCNDHSEILEEQSQMMRLIIYGIITLLGCVMTFTQVLAVFK